MLVVTHEAKAFREKGIEVRQTTGEMLEQAYDLVCNALDAALKAVVTEDQGAAQDVLVRRDEFWRVSKQVLQRQVERLALEDADRRLKHRMQTAVLDKLRRIYLLAEHIAAKALPEKVVARELQAQA